MLNTRLEELKMAVKQFADSFNAMNYEWDKDQVDILSELEANCLYPFSESFDEIECKVSNWAKAVQDEIDRTIADPLREKMRVIACEFAQQNDRNGCYTDANTLLEFGEVTSYMTAVGHFVWVANSDITDEADNFHDAIVMVKKAGMYEKSLQVLEAMAKMQDPSFFMNYLLQNNISDLLKKQPNFDEIVEFRNHLEKSVDAMLEFLDIRGYDSRYDVKISVDGKELSLDMNADTYSRLCAFLEDEMKEV